MEVIDRATGRVSAGPAMPGPEALFGCVTVGDKIMVIGGQKLRGAGIVYDLRTKQLVPYPLALPDSDFAAALQHRGRIYVVGGASLRQYHATEAIQVFAPTTETMGTVPQAAGK